MEKRNAITYGFEDIKRYRQGLMSREEMHAFEKASMEDPFLADALEGYMQADMQLADEHLTNIKDRIQEKEEVSEKAPVVQMPQRSFKMWRVAAMVIVIAGAGLITYKVLDNKKIEGGESGGLAKVDEVKPSTQQGSASLGTDSGATATATVADTIKAPQGSFQTSTYANVNPAQKSEGLETETDDKKIAEAKVSPEKDKEEGTKIAALQVNTKNNSNTNSKRYEDVTFKAVPSNNGNAAASTNNGYANVVTNEFRGRVLSPTNQPLVNANILLDNSKKQILTDESGNFSFDSNSKDSVLLATVVANGNANRVQLRANTNNFINIGTIAMKNDTGFDVSVTGIGRKNKMQVNDTLSTKPEGGWESFQHYVAGKLGDKVDTTGGDIRTNGLLELEFYVDANGLPKDFKVVSSTDPNVNQAAIDAVKSGPKWTTRKKKARILIRF